MRLRCPRGATPLALATLLGACSSDEPPAPPPRPVLFTTVAYSTDSQLGQYAGTIQARYESTLGFRTDGRIARREVDVGDVVKAGDLLATLDPSQRAYELRSSEGDRADSRAQLINAQADAQRQRELFAKGVGSRSQLEQIETQLSTREAQLRQAEANEQQARDALSYTRLYADYPGVVTEIQAEVGQVVSPGQAVLTLARPDVREAVFDLPATQVAALHPELRYRVTSQVDPQVSTGARVREIAPQSDATTRTRRVRLSLDEQPDALRLGTLVRISLDNATTPVAPLPASALVEREGRSQVWVIGADDHVSLQPVEIARRDPDHLWISSGVAAGARVVIAGANSLQPGQAVKMDQERSQ